MPAWHPNDLQSFAEMNEDWSWLKTGDAKEWNHRGN